MQKLVKAAKEGTKDRLEKTKAAVKRGRSFIRTKSFVGQGLWPPLLPRRGGGWGDGPGSPSRWPLGELRGRPLCGRCASSASERCILGFLRRPQAWS